MKIYFAGSIRGGRDDAALYFRIIEFLKNFGTVFTEHIGDATLTNLGDEGVTDRFIHDRDLDWLTGADVVVAEVTTVSMGVGYEIGQAVAMEKRILCLYRPSPGKKLSAMIAGCPGLTLVEYHDAGEAFHAVSEFFNRF